MTTETLRKLLVAGAAVSALSVAACSEKPDTPPPAGNASGVDEPVDYTVEK